MATKVDSIREVPATKLWKKGDVLVLFGELFNRGYANGLVEAAERRGMTIVYGTVGRREKDGILRGLTAEECVSQPKSLINVPLEAGFDMEVLQNGQSLVDMMKEVKLTDWESFKVAPALLNEAIEKGAARFKTNVQKFLVELKPLIPKGANVHFAHLMAGGVPRARILMPLMNKVFKGSGDRYMESEGFWNSGLGQVANANFRQVSADTYKTLIDESKNLRDQIQKEGGSVSYSGYGYHGTEVMIHDEYEWQSYAPYLQGWAKIALENYAEAATKSGLKASVYNCPEILTNSSSIFQGVEVPLYPLLKALKREGEARPKTKELWDACQALLKAEHTLKEVLDICEKTLSHPALKAQAQFSKWPQHNTKEQMEVLLAASDKIIACHKSDKALMTAVLSEVVFEACGETMLADMAAPKRAVSWINHDLVAKYAVR